MNVAILGPNGQLGSDLFRAGQAHKSAVKLIPIGRQDLDVSNVSNIARVLAERDFDVLINCTSYHKTDEVESNATLAFAINAHAVKAMAEFCRERDVPFVHISTDYVFSGVTDRPYVESDATAPLNVYGASKAMGETLAQLSYPEGTYVLRVASLFGVAGASGKGGNFVETMIRVGREKGKLRVIDDITMSPTATADVARMIFDLLKQDAEPGVYHAVNTGQATWYEFACEIIRQAGVTAEVEPIASGQFPAAAQRPAYSVLSNEKIRTVLGEIPHWRNAVRRYLETKGYVTESVAKQIDTEAC